jgi:hypothetical protein
MLAPLSDIAIAALIGERKDIPDGLCPLAKLSKRNGHIRRDYEITCATGNSFVVIIRQSSHNVFDFSAILGYKVPGFTKIFLLRRYNGKSHYHSNALEDRTVKFRDFHIHTATERYQKIGRNEEHFAAITNRYTNLDGAIQCLLSDCGFRAPMEESPLFTGKVE